MSHFKVIFFASLFFYGAKLGLIFGHMADQWEIYCDPFFCLSTVFYIVAATLCWIVSGFSLYRSFFIILSICGFGDKK
jgi:MFS family permease